MSSSLSKRRDQSVKQQQTRIMVNCIKSSTNKYSLPQNNIFRRTQPPPIETIDVLKSISPVYRFIVKDKQTVTQFSSIEAKYQKALKFQTQKTLPIQDAKRLDYESYNIKKQTTLDKYKQNLREYLANDVKYKRRFFKVYKEKDKEFYVPHRLRDILKDEQSESKHIEHPVLRHVVDEDNKLKSMSVIREIQNKKRQQIKQEELKEREYYKDLMDKFLEDEQIYFQELQGLEDQAIEKFRRKFMLINTFVYDTLAQPENQFVSYKDLRYEPDSVFGRNDHKKKSNMPLFDPYPPLDSNKEILMTESDDLVFDQDELNFGSSHPSNNYETL